ncbi:serine hydrolase [Jiangella rhizosphaerae]|uniref:Serine hydrolase n=1 Tax=Jiangella rhizosphaerae TaxID=2293569 RepID=A0A418KVC1_9ACTN|nr:serine hydrolase [Jiangella rhizosphaerae]RIQ34094.1 serine hydrolase [Jiangella rhizosphaerae]
MRRAVVSLAVVAALAGGCGGAPAPGASRTPSAPEPSTTVAQAGPAEPEPAGSWDELRGRLTALDADVGMVAARVTDDGGCEPVAELDPATARPMASIFKLYVLGAVAAAVDAGELAWTDQLTVSGAVRSLPSGELQDAPDGTRVTVREAAAAMIAISDNTAAELLIDRVGRSAVEDAMRTLGHTRPDLNRPFLTTREFFTVGWGRPSLRADWARAGAAARARILAALPPGPLRVTGRDIVDPAWDSGVDWFGSALDVCAAQAALHVGRSDPALRSVLGRNRGVTIDGDEWPYVSFKGGSAPGVVTASWYGERADGERYVFVMQAAAADAAAVADHDAFFALGAEAFELLAADHQGP